MGDLAGGEFSSTEESVKSIQSAPIDESIRSLPASAPLVESEPQDVAQYSLDVAETIADSEITVNSELFLPFLIITVILGGLTAYYFWNFKKSK